MPNRNLADIRNHYQRDALDWNNLPDNPFTAFETWMQAAISANLYEPTAMTLATVDDNNQPHARIVLLKGLDNGFIFYTNYRSPKGQDIDHNPKAACTFFWPELERQVRIEGEVQKVSADMSDTYFNSRPKDSQLAACASAQGTVIADRAELENNFNKIVQTFADRPITRPAHWGGYRLIPTRFEFWQGRPNRLHDRLVFRLTNDVWERERLSP